MPPKGSRASTSSGGASSSDDDSSGGSDSESDSSEDEDDENEENDVPAPTCESPSGPWSDIGHARNTDPGVQLAWQLELHAAVYGREHSAKSPIIYKSP